VPFAQTVNSAVPAKAGTFLPAASSGTAPSVSCVVLRQFLAAMLLELPSRHICDFWAGHPLKTGSRTLTGTELLNYFWDIENRLPLSYVLEVLDSIEGFLVSRGLTAGPFVRAFFEKINNGSLLTPSLALKAINRVMNVFFNNGRDVRETMLKLIKFANAFLVRGSLVKYHRLGREESGDISGCIVWIHDRTFGGAVPLFDVELWGRALVRYIPMQCGLPWFDEVSTLAQRKSIGEIVGPSGLRQEEGSVFLDGTILAKKMSFRAFCASRGISLDCYDVPDTEVFYAVRSHYCRARARTVITRGTVYGAPVYLTFVRFRKNGPFRGNPIQKIIKDIDEVEKVRWPAIHDLFNLYLLAVSVPYKVRFDKSTDTFTVNGARVMTKTPARLLARMLREYCDNGRTLFDIREFTSDNEILDNLYAKPNINVRIQRMVEALKEKAPFLSVMRENGNGRLLLQVGCGIEYSEKE
jgi:hypothetical protein